MQNYLKPNKVITFQEQIDIFSYRSQMNDMSLKYQEPKEVKICVCTKELTNNHLYECTTLNNGEQLKFNYEKILNGTLHQQKYILNILKKNLETHTKITLASRAGN